MSGGGSFRSGDSREIGGFQMGGRPWYGYWYGVIFQVVESSFVFNPIPGALTYPPHHLAIT